MEQCCFGVGGEGVNIIIFKHVVHRDAQACSSMIENSLAHVVKGSSCEIAHDSSRMHTLHYLGLFWSESNGI